MPSTDMTLPQLNGRLFLTDGGIETSRVMWEAEPVTVTADEVMRPVEPDEERSQRDEIADWLRDLLHLGRMKSHDVQSKAKQAGFGTDVVRHRIPLRPADRAEQHRIGGESPLHILFRDRLAMRVVGASADQAFVGLEAAAELLVHGSDQLLDLPHRLGADAVAGKEEEFFRCHVVMSSNERSRALASGRAAARQGSEGLDA